MHLFDVYAWCLRTHVPVCTCLFTCTCMLACLYSCAQCLRVCLHLGLQMQHHYLMQCFELWRVAVGRDACMRVCACMGAWNAYLQCMHICVRVCSCGPMTQCMLCMYACMRCRSRSTHNGCVWEYAHCPTKRVSRDAWVPVDMRVREREKEYEYEYGYTSTG